MDAHFLEYHLNHRRDTIQREVRAIRLESLARGQRSGRLMRLVRVLFSRRVPPLTTTSSKPTPAPRPAPKLAH